jgi:CCCH-type zinc finger/Zinc finger C-x8-C-x5-C-x3-H type (and similar)
MATRTPTSPVSIRNTNVQSSSKLSTGLRKVSGSSVPSSSPSNKNLSHVPCKFFKQGACQAGNSCPFSHTMEAVDQSPCKYFQKGNCKFGTKCALAHILPDGRRVNTRGGQHPQTLQAVNGQQQQQQQQPLLNNQQLSSLSQSPVVVHGGHSISSHQGSMSGQQSSLSSFNSPPGGVGSANNGISAQSLPHNLVGLNGHFSDVRAASSHDNITNSRLKNNIYSPNEASSPFSRSFADGIFTSPVGSARSVSSSANLWPHVRQNRQASSPFPPDDFAIDDDDPFEEDFVPSSLTDLLTPQERKRRGSRPSSSLSHTVPAGGIHPDIWGTTNSNRISSPRMVRQSFSDNANGSSPLKVLQPIGTPERTSSITAASPGFSSSSSTQNNFNNYSNLLSPKPLSVRREKEREILREDDNHETQFFMEEEIGEQEKRLQNLRLVNEQLY